LLAVDESFAVAEALTGIGGKEQGQVGDGGPTGDVFGVAIGLAAVNRDG